MTRVRKAVITAAGKGTRQYPASSAVQKEMFPLVDRDGLTKPVIQIIGEEAIDSGIEELCIITQPGEEEQYRQYFKRFDDDVVKSFRGKPWAILESEKLGAFGVPTMALAGADFGIFGPVLDPVPEGDMAVRLWNATKESLSLPFLYETKRVRRGRSGPYKATATGQ